MSRTTQPAAPDPWRNRIVGQGDEAPDQLLANPSNWRVHPMAQREALAAVLDEVGWVQRVIVNKTTQHVVDGHLRVALALSRDEPTIPVNYVELDVREESLVLAALDPIAAMATTDKDKLRELLEQAQVTDDQLRAAISDAAGLQPEPAEGKTDPDAVPDERATDIQRGDLFALGDHRLLCGDSRNADDVARVMDGAKLDMLLTDPPYCSGGFQEAGKKAGSIGTRGDEMIANDTLSTRGYTALIKSILIAWNTAVVYLFTDWRMWVNLFDVTESSGYGVRAMVVWDKGTPGMGRGWRSQHELILCGTRVAMPFDMHKAQGNVIQSKRTGNVHHATEKPVDLLVKILTVTDICETVGDPF